jgi:simple sugar transport system permease protein
MEAISKILFAMLRMSAPLILAGIGGILSQQVGLINIALEGLMLVGAFSAVVGTFYFHSIFIGIFFAILVSMLFAWIFSLFIIKLRANLIVVGIAINIFSLGFARYMLQLLFGTKGTFAPVNLPGFQPINIPWLSSIPFLGSVLSGHTILVYLSWLLTGFIYVFLKHTLIGIHIRAVGENPSAAESVGINIRKVQYIALIGSGLFCGLAGVQLSLGNVRLFSENMVNGRGFMALAAVYFGQGQPLLVTFASLLFGFFEALQLSLQTQVKIPPQWPQMLPFVIIVITLTLVSLRQKHYKILRKRLWGKL